MTKSLQVHNQLIYFIVVSLFFSIITDIID